MIKMGTIGLGGYGKFYIDFIEHEKDEIQLAGVVVRNPSKTQELHDKLVAEGCRIYPSFEAILEQEKMDLIGLPVGIGMHCPYTCASVEAGVNVLVEKPAAGTVEEIDRMIEARDRTGKFVAVGFHDIYNVNFQKAKQMILDGAIGKIKRSYTAGLWPRPDEYYERNPWAGKIKDGNDFVYDSPANNAMAHFLNLQLFMLGSGMDSAADPAQITGKLYKGRDYLENFDTCSICMTLADGTDHFYTVSHACLNKKEPELFFEGEKGTLLITKTMMTLTAGHELLKTPNSYGDTGRFNMLPSVIANLKGDKQLYCSLEMARCHTNVINTIQKALEIEIISQVSHTEIDDKKFCAIDNIDAKFADAVNNWKIMELQK